MTRRAAATCGTTSAACANELGTTVFLTTHYLEEADALCDRVLVIDHGKIIAEGVPDELKRRISGDVVTLSVSADPARAAGHPGPAIPACARSRPRAGRSG